jgi:hypothetical protein
MSTSGKADDSAAPRPKSWLANMLGDSSAPRWTVIAGVMAVLVPLVSLITWIVGRITEPEETPKRPPSPSSPTPTALKVARSKCAPSSNSVRLGDGGYTLIIERAAAKKNPGIDTKVLACIFDELDVPDSVVSQVESTTPLSGLQKADFSGFSAFWTYHPDRGLNMTIAQNRS